MRSIFFGVWLFAQFELAFSQARFIDGDESSTTMPIWPFFAIAHALPVFAVGYFFKNRWLTYLVAAGMFFLAVAVGNLNYALVDILSVVFGCWLGLTYVVEEEQRKNSLELRRGIGVSVVSQGDKKLPTIRPQVQDSDYLIAEKTLSKITDKVMKIWIDHGLLIVPETEDDRSQMWLSINSFIRLFMPDSGVFHKGVSIPPRDKNKAVEELFVDLVIWAKSGDCFQTLLNRVERDVAHCTLPADEFEKYLIKLIKKKKNSNPLSDSEKREMNKRLLDAAKKH